MSSYYKILIVLQVMETGGCNHEKSSPDSKVQSATIVLGLLVKTLQCPKVYFTVQLKGDCMWAQLAVV